MNYHAPAPSRQWLYIIATVFAIAILFSACSHFASTQATVYRFTTSGSWTNPANWSPSYPGTTIASADSVIIGTGITCTADYPDSVRLKGAIRNSGTLNIGVQLICDTSGAVINDSGGVIYVYTQARFYNFGHIDNRAKSSLASYGGLVNMDKGVFSNSGSMAFNPGGATVNAGGFTNEAGGVIIDSVGFSNNGSILNRGTITIGYFPRVSAFYNKGSFVNDKGGSFNINGAAYNTAQGTMSNIGMLSVSVTGSLQNDGTLKSISMMISSGVIENHNQWTIDRGGSLLNNPKSSFLNYSTFTNNGAVNNYSGSVFENMGTMDNMALGQFANFSATVNSEGLFTNEGSISTDASTMFNNTTGGIFNNSGKLANAGRLSVYTDSKLHNLAGGSISNTGAFIGQKRSMLDNDGVFTNMAGAQFLPAQVYNKDSIYNMGYVRVSDSVTNAGVIVSTDNFDLIGNYFLNTYGGVINNADTLHNVNVMYNQGLITNTGYLYNLDTLYNYGVIRSLGLIENVKAAVLTNNDTIYTTSKFVNEGDIYNGEYFSNSGAMTSTFGTIRNFFNGTLLGYTGSYVDYRITLQPANATSAGGNATFTTAASQTAVTYQWYYSPTGTTYQKLQNGGNYSGTLTATLQVSGITPALNGYWFKCRLSGPELNNTGYTTPAMLTYGTVKK